MNKKLKYIIGIMIIIVASMMFGTSSYARSLKKSDWESPRTLVTYMHGNAKDFVTTAAKKVIGHNFKGASPEIGEGVKWSTCIDPHNLAARYRIPRIVNMLDIDITKSGETGLKTIGYKSYKKSKTGINKKKQITSDTYKELASRMAYAIYKNKNHTPRLGDSYAMTLASIWQKLGRSTSGTKSILWDMAKYEGKNIGILNPENFEWYSKADKYVKGIDDDSNFEKLKKNKSVVPGASHSTEVTKKTTGKGKNKKTTEVTKYYVTLGPFQATYGGGSAEIDYLKIYDKSSGKTTTKTSSQYKIINAKGNKISIKSGQDFYIKVEVAFTEDKMPNKKFTLQIKQGSSSIYSARVCVVALPDKTISQNIMLAAAYKTTVKGSAKWVIIDNPVRNIKVQKLGINDKDNYNNNNAEEIEPEAIGGVSFIIYKDGQPYTSATTGDDGTVTIKDVPAGTYKAYETGMDSDVTDYGVIHQKEEDRWTNEIIVNFDDETQDEDELTMTATNSQYTNLRILKYVENSYGADSATTTNTKTGEKYTPINGVGFKIQYYNKDHEVPSGKMVSSLNMDGTTTMVEEMVPYPTWQWIESYTFGIPSSIKYTDNENDAMVFTTGTSYGTYGGNTDAEAGEIILRNLPYGEYRALEYSIPDGEPYDFDPDWTDHMKELITTELENDSNWNSVFNTFKCSNPWYVKVSGYVFTPQKSGKEEKSLRERDGSKYENGDKIVNNAKVTLMHKNASGEYEKYETSDKSEVTGIIYSGYDKEHNNEYKGDGGYEFKIRLSSLPGGENAIKDFAVKIEYDALDFESLNPSYNDDATIAEMQNRYNAKQNIELIVGATSKVSESAEDRQSFDNLKEVTGTENADDRITNGDKTVDKVNMVYEDESKNKQVQYELSKRSSSDIEGNETMGQSSGIPIDYSTGFAEENEHNAIRINGDPLEANTIKAMYYLDGANTENNTYDYTHYDIRSQTTNSLAQVIELNLGLIQRESPELQTTNTIIGVNAQINGFSNTYKRGRTSKVAEKGLNAGVTYVNSGDLEKKARFPFEVYKSDVETVTENPDNKELTVYITYRIDVSNLSTSLYSQVNELALYYDKHYSIEHIGTSTEKVTEDGKEIDSYIATDDLKDKIGDSAYRSKDCGLTIDGKEYNKTYINTKEILKINHGELNSDGVVEKGTSNTKNIYVTYKVDREELKEMHNRNDYAPEFENIVEIESYTTYSDEFKTLYNGIDKNSAPGNVQSNITLSGTGSDEATVSAEKHKDLLTQFDNDTGIAEEFVIRIKEGNRQLSGKVFLDASSGELKIAQEREGNGKYVEADGDKGLEGVKVELYEVDGNEDGTPKALEYDDNGLPIVKQDGVHIAADNTNSDGDYTISGFIPGYYIVKYTYGNQVVIKDSDGKTINAVDYKSATIKNENKNAEYKQNYKDETGKENRNDYTKDIENVKWYLTDNIDETDKIAASDDDFLQQLKDKSDSETRYTEALDNYKTRETIDRAYRKIDFDTSAENYKLDDYEMDSYTPQFAIGVELNTLSSENYYMPTGYYIYNMDFGIVERPRQEMTISKRVSNTKITLANGQVLLDGDPADKNTKMSGLKYIGPSASTANGTVNIELDSELIHGSTLELTYEITVHNKSELDYSCEQYYKYGMEAISDWTIGEQNAYLVKITPQVYDYVDNNLTFDKANNSDWNIVSAGDLKVSDTSINTIKTYNTIVHYEGEAFKEINPGNNPTTKLVLSRVLSNTNDDLSYDNNIELITGEFSHPVSGREHKVRVGTFFDGGGIGASSETTTITPPTGENRDYLIYIITGIGTLLILAAGIIIIKKKVIK